MGFSKFGGEKKSQKVQTSLDMADPALLQCYNKGCAQKFKEEDNNEGRIFFISSALTLVDYMLWYSESCVYHPGVPGFHDAMKVSCVVQCL